MQRTAETIGGLGARIASWWRGLGRTSQCVLAATAAGGALLIAMPMPPSVGARAPAALALTLFTVALWATTALPQPVTAALFIATVLLTGLASPAAALSGFMSTSLLLVLGGLLIGTAAEKSGLGRYIGARFLGRFRSSYSGLVLGTLIGTSLLTFLVPVNMGRLAITIPIAIAVAEEAGYEPGSQGYIGLLVTTVIGNFTIALAVLPGNLLNIMIVGTGEALYGFRISYMYYLMLCGPVLGLAKAILVWRTILWVYPAPPPRSAGTADVPQFLSHEARRVSAILAGAILLWVTDFLHGIRPGIVAIGAGLLCIAPGIGVLTPAQGLAWRRLVILVWVGTVLSLAAVLTETGASRLVSELIARLTAVEGASPLYGHLAIAYSSSLLATLTTIGGAVPIAASAVADIARATGLPLDIGILSISSGMSALLFPYIAAPVMVGLMLGKVRVGDAARFTVAAAIATWLVIIPLNALWWRLIGVLP